MEKSEDRQGLVYQVLWDFSKDKAAWWYMNNEGNLNIGTENFSAEDILFRHSRKKCS